MLGSCFTDNIGNKLSRLLFDLNLNPFGVIYNPLSIENSLHALLNKKEYTQNDLRLHSELWFSFDHYTKFSHTNPEKALQKINSSFQPAKENLTSIQQLIITFGTAWVYQLKETQQIVSNCHKIPAKEFNRFLLNVSDITAAYKELIPQLLRVNKDLKITFTLSPVRHLKDSLVGNQQSKAILHIAIQEIIKAFPNTCQYFPAYEIMMDDLRDYRFYEKDLIHPNNQAIDYIWEMFYKNMLTGETQILVKEVEAYLKLKEHKVMHPNTQNHVKLIQKQQKLRGKLSTYPFFAERL